MTRPLLSALLALACVATSASATDTHVQDPFLARWHSTSTPPAPVPALVPVPRTIAPGPEQKLPVSVDQALYLIRSTLLTLNDANRSGNYTVLRDLGSPAFQAGNSSADLGAIFNDLRKRNFDLFSAALIAPQLAAPPKLDNGMLRLTGSFPTRPLQISFDLLFQSVGGQWKLFGISVQTPSAPPNPAQAAR